MTVTEKNRIQGMVRSIDQYRNGDPKAIMAGSHAQALFALTDARNDILALWAKIEELAAAEPSEPAASFQERVQPWMMACFGPEISADKLERSDRFMEEALELVQAGDYQKERVYALVEYVYGRDQGEINQEVGGVMVTLAAHCLAHGVDMHAAAETELARIWTKVEKIRAKQAAKPTGSALPVATPTPSPADRGAVEAETTERVARAIYEAAQFDYEFRTINPDGEPYGEWKTAVMQAEAALAALALPAAEVKVKPLEWETYDPGTICKNGHSGRRIVTKARHPYGVYTLETEDSLKWWVLLGFVGKDLSGPFTTEVEAKAAAQAHHDATILAALAAPSQAREG